MAELLSLALLLGLLLSFFGSLVWIFQDARRRGKSGLLVALLAAFIAWPLSLLVWIALRPSAPDFDRTGRRHDWSS